MAQTMTLTAEPRTRLGTRASKQLRAQGRIPAMLEADREHPHVDLSIELHAFLTARRAHGHLFDIQLGPEVETAVVERIHWDPIRGEMLHVEFRRVKKGVVDDFEVPLVIFGQPKAGVASLLLSQAAIRTLPSLIPDSIEIDVQSAEEGAVITAREVSLPEGVAWGIPLDTELVTISSAEGEIEISPIEEAAEVEIIGEKAREEALPKD